LLEKVKEYSLYDFDACHKIASLCLFIELDGGHDGKHSKKESRERISHYLLFFFAFRSAHLFTLKIHLGRNPNESRTMR